MQKVETRVLICEGDLFPCFTGNGKENLIIVIRESTHQKCRTIEDKLQALGISQLLQCQTIMKGMFLYNNCISFNQKNSLLQPNSLKRYGFQRSNESLI